MTCLCGLSFSAQHLAQHQRSRAHRVALTLQAVKDRPSVWWPEVAAKHHVSRELVRQIAERLGMTAKGRHARCRLQEFVAQHRGTVLLQAASWLREHGLQVELVMNAKQWSRSVIRVEGKLVCVSRSGHFSPRSGIIVIFKPCAPAQTKAYIWKIPVGWLVMRPREIRFKARTCASLTGDYMQYLDRWQILRRGSHETHRAR